MKTIVVGIYGIDWLETLKFLPHSWNADSKTRVVIHHNPELSTGSQEANFDYLITRPLDLEGGFHGFNANILNSLRINFTELKRPDKATQSLQINACVFSDPIIRDRFRPIKTFTNLASVACKSYAFGTELSGVDKIYIKAFHGARGCGQLLVDLKLAPLEHVLSHIDTYQIDSMSETKKEVAAFIKGMPGVTLFDNDEHFLGESLGMLKQQRYFAQEVIPNVKSEWRILIGAGKIYAHSRDLKIEHGMQRPNCKSSLLSALEGKPSLLESVPELFIYRKAIEEMVRHLDIKFGSLDLFIADSGDFGFFEYSNQFGSDDYSVEFMVDFCKSAIWSLVSHGSTSLFIETINRIRAETTTDSIGDINKVLRKVNDDDIAERYPNGFVEEKRVVYTEEERKAITGKSSHPRTASSKPEVIVDELALVNTDILIPSTVNLTQMFLDGVNQRKSRQNNWNHLADNRIIGGKFKLISEDDERIDNAMWRLTTTFAKHSFGLSTDFETPAVKLSEETINVSYASDFLSCLPVLITDVTSGLVLVDSSKPLDPEQPYQ